MITKTKLNSRALLRIYHQIIMVTIIIIIIIETNNHSNLFIYLLQ